MGFPVGCRFNNSMIHKDDVEQISKNQQNIKTGMQCRWMQLICIVCIVLATVLIFIILTWTLSTYYPCHSNQLPVENFPQDQRNVSSVPENFSTEHEQTLGTTNASAFLVERNEWRAMPPAGPLSKLKLPVPYVIISHTVTNSCTTNNECMFNMRFLQIFHMKNRQWSDIAYNFVAGGNGFIYTGRNWDHVGAHSFGFNNKSIGISLMGTFHSVAPQKVQLDAVRKLIRLGVDIGKISPDYKLLGQRQISQSLSPGDALYDIIKKWPHWSFKP